MLHTLSRNQRTIAWFLTALFYLELVLVPVVARANERPLPYKWTAYAAADLNLPKDKDTSQINTEFHKASQKTSDTRKARHTYTPAHTKGTFTTGPTQPETQSFQSVNANNMVDLFTGDFSYNIPLLDVGGYPVNLHYQSGITMDQEASWVGLGWNINPGVISRNMRGLPDDFQGEEEVSKTASMKPNRTIGATVDAAVGGEIFGLPIKISAGQSTGVFHNTYKGWGLEKSLHATVDVGIGGKGHLTGGLSVTNNSQNGLDISPSMGFQLGSNENKLRGGITIGTNYNSRTGIQNLQITGEIKQQDNAIVQQLINNVTRFSSVISFAQPSYTPTISVPFNSSQYSLRVKAGAEYQGLFPNKQLRGYLSIQTIKDQDKTQRKPAYGYLYYEKSNNNLDALLDFNREKDIAWNENAPNIAMPVYTYDTWSISGEGTGGMFRAYRSDIGFVYDHRMATRSNSNNLGLDFGGGSYMKAGIDYSNIHSVTNSNAWTGDNLLDDVIPFREADTTFENVYFKNPGEKTSVNKSFQKAIGGDNLMRVDLSSDGPVFPASCNMSLFKNSKRFDAVKFGMNTVRTTRDKRTQVISYLTAREAAYAGLDTVIRSFPVNSFPAAGCINNYEEIKRNGGDRKAHHLSEITVLNDDGRRYVYGIPVYNKKQVDITMSTDKGSNATGLVGYTKDDKSEKNDWGKEGYFNREIMPAYSHSFLLSGILSADYSDLTGNGITEDDNGDAVKFNYSRVYGLDSFYKWRAPYQQNQAAYNEGLKTDSRDERGSFTYGEREVWYLNSVESKTMVATFVLDTDSIRQDSYGVLGEDGGQNTGQKLYRLKKINLFTKADYLKNGISAKPVKTVYFEYSYELCKNNPGSLSGNGKLTLKKVWFSYNNNNKGQRNPYVFAYHAANPAFSQKSVDRWGNYKNPKGNPGNTGDELTNADYPYALQPGVKNWDSVKAADSSAPWTLSEINLPSGGKIKVSYESDDYAFVQNKRAMQFFSLAGFGISETDAMQGRLYIDNKTNKDYHYVFINVTEPVSDAADIRRKYLDGVEQLFFKLAVNMPGDKWGNGFELVPCYAEIEDYGIRANSNNKIIWIKVKSVSGHESPFITAALQFLRLNLPSKAYTWSEPGDNIDVRAAIGMLASVAGGVLNVFKVIGFGTKARIDNRCNKMVLEKSFIRLDNPVYKKFGGGLRVKKVELCDNWNAMTGQQQSVYGQTYTYTDSVEINGIKTAISSGVASYEPVIGNDENPFRVPLRVYTEKVGALAPANYLYSEEPFAETFFPAPMVGYSKVRVQTIHKDRKSANGFDETAFYTTKDFPTLVEITPIDGESKKTYRSPISNPFWFDARSYVVLSQGFKIELNDMNGKLKSQATYSQLNAKTPISYTYNYYRVQMDNAAQPKLSNTVSVVDSANGIIDTAAEIGKDVEIMIDVREQTSETNSGSIESNLDVINILGFPVPIVVPVPLFNAETNRYRSVAVLKVVNRYGILDSVLHIEKGSSVTTQNLLYDGETGDVLLSQTNNEFDDPVYNFNYPAHWAYSGMGPAYKNIGTVLKGVYFRKGILYQNGKRVATEKYFESGDEVLVYGKNTRNDTTWDHCNDNYYLFAPDITYKRLWAIDGRKGKEGQKGIYFIDHDGLPHTADECNLTIIRSGKRNMAGVPIGSVTSLKSPVKKVNNITRLVLDSTINVIAAGAGRLKDFWKVDTAIYAKDTTVLGWRKAQYKEDTLYAIDNYTIEDWSDGGSPNLGAVPNHKYFEASSYSGGYVVDIRSWLKFDMHNIPQGAVIDAATLYLYGCINKPHQNYRNSNACYLERLTATWPRSVININTPGSVLSEYFWDPNQTTTETTTRVTLVESPKNQSVVGNDALDITGMAQAMLNQYYNSKGVVSPGMRIRLIDPHGALYENSSLNYNTAQTPEECGLENSCTPAIRLRYHLPCSGEQRIIYDHGNEIIQCRDMPVDSIVCKPLINDTAVNFYRTGILGNWRMDRAYTYYSSRKQTDPSIETNIRTDGEIKAFMPYWNFTDSTLYASTDTSRWVWNSELTLFNNKGLEIENHDPLNRYNAGLYGYNKSLPVAVAQNARNREIAFDGFEDYGYQTDACIHCMFNRHADFGTAATLVDTLSHSGKYSLYVPGNQTVSTTFPLATIAQDAISPQLSIKEDSVPLVYTSVNSSGQGLTVKYTTMSANSFYNLPFTSNIDFYSNGQGIPYITSETGFYVTWKGYIQPRYSGTYTFLTTADDYMRLYLNEVEIGNPAQVGNHTWGAAYESSPVYLQAGVLYPIRMQCDQYGGPYQFKLEWKSEGVQSVSRDKVPASVLYPENSDLTAITNNTVHRDTTWCVALKHPTAKAVINNRFSPYQAKKVVVSAWIKQAVDCVTGNYNNAQLQLVFNNAPASTFTLKPTGNIIDGWQRIEDTLTIPATATSCTLKMMATSPAQVNFDDIRIHPFNGNMKSFVYSPINLRLMAELDENNYATFYEYDDDGTLIRVKKETERGVKTIKESRSALLKQ